MYGKDEDPVMRSMGLDKEFVIVLDVQSDGKVLIETAACGHAYARSQ